MKKAPFEKEIERLEAVEYHQDSEARCAKDSFFE
jgi:hypothetical protein